MIQESRDKYISYGISALFHVAVFAIVCLAGLFVQVSGSEKQVVDVTVYDTEGARGGGASFAGSGDSASLAEAAEAVSINVDKERLPEIAQEYTKEPEKQQQYRKEHHAIENVAASAEKALLSGNSRGMSDAQGTGDGSGIGKDAGTGSGTGSGAGTSQGDGTDNGRDEPAALVPKTPPRFLGGSSPVYPEDLQYQGIGGTVLLSLKVAADGSVTGVEIAASSGYQALDLAAIQAAYSYSFAPARNIHDEPVACITKKRVIFEP